MGVIKHITLALLVLSMLLSTLMVPLIYLDFSVRRDYIAKVLCIERDEPMTVCGGSCFLAEQLKRAAQQQEKEATMPNQKLEFSFFYKALSSMDFRTHGDLVASPVSFRGHQHVGASFLHGVFRPPRPV